MLLDIINGYMPLIIIFKYAIALLLKYIADNLLESLKSFQFSQTNFSIFYHPCPDRLPDI